MMVLVPVRSKFPLQPIFLFNNVFLVAGGIIGLAIHSLDTRPRSFGVIDLLAIPAVLGSGWLFFRFGRQLFKGANAVDEGFLSPVGERAWTMLLTGLLVLAAGIVAGLVMDFDRPSQPQSYRRTETKPSGIIESRPSAGTTQSHGKIYIAPPVVAATTTTNLAPSHP